MIQAGADLTRRDNTKGHDMVERTVLSGEDNGEILTMLFQAGMSPTAPLSRGRTPLERVLRLGHEGELRGIVRVGVSLNAPVGQNESALFALRSWNTNPAFVRAMVRLGANPAQRNSIDQTPLQAAQ